MLDHVTIVMRVRTLFREEQMWEVSGARNVRGADAMVTITTLQPVTQSRYYKYQNLNLDFSSGAYIAYLTNEKSPLAEYEHNL